MTKPFNASLTQGQIWISETEPELGMGILTGQDPRTLTVFFPAGDCTRRYSRSAPPIRRIRFKPGDRILSRSGRQMTVEAVEEHQGLFTYIQQDWQLLESELSLSMDLDLPFDRLMSGLGKGPLTFDLRCRIRQARAAFEASDARGFLGGQVDLIPHQFYIAGQVCSRYFPRVLLSDETGLGKTIEAGLILLRLLTTGQISRVLVIVPTTLVHQWFIELFRKFSLRFSIFDTAHCEEALAEGLNPFAQDQCVIIAQDLIQERPDIGRFALKVPWDMAVMDEAHHLTEDPGFFRFFTALSRQVRGLLLLTATPEQLGLETHFAQLNLLDPDRYPALDRFVREAKGYEAAAQKARQLLAQNKPVDHLLDTFGPGRVVFRNRRRSIQGFPPRQVVLCPLDGTAAQIQAVNQTLHPGSGRDLTDLSDDPRVICLADLCRKVKPEKILVICRSKETAAAVVQGLLTHIALDAARFDESMDLLQRDRQAAFFADPEGARILVCSEIGSEGRNFQFARRLFLFDLPDNPELLEQRIGRVDRIGQHQEIILHVPYVRGSVLEVLALWYDQGLGLFRENINGLYAIFSRFEAALSALMVRTAQDHQVDPDALLVLIQETRDHTLEVQRALDQGRHILLELNSFRQGPARELIQAVQAMDGSPGLFDLMETLLDFYGVDLELIREASGNSVVRLLTDQTLDEEFPALPGRSGFATFDRATAIARDDLTFLTWDHPFVLQVMEYFLAKGQGTASLAMLKGAAHPGLVLETLFLLELPDGEACPNASRFFSPEPIRLLVDHKGAFVQAADLGKAFPQNLLPDNPGWFQDLPDLTQDLLPQLLQKSQAAAAQKAQKMKQESLDQMTKVLGDEGQRLKTLARTNPGITDQEITALTAEQQALGIRISQSRLRLDAVRLIRLWPGH